MNTSTPPASIQQSKSNQMGPSLYGLSNYNTQQVKVFIRSFEAESLSSKRFYDRRPDAAANPKDYIAHMNLELISLIVPDAFAGDTGIALVKGMNLTQLEELGHCNDPILKMTVKNTFGRLFSIKSAIQDMEDIEAIRQYLTYSPAWQF